jgi:hypothetical protein
MEFCKDGWNSFFRILFGCFVAIIPSMFLPICIGYQVFTTSDKIETVELHEFFAGYVLGILMSSSIKLSMALGTI